MPTAILAYSKENRLLALVLAEALPRLAAPHLNVEGAPRHEGGVTEKEVIVRLQAGDEEDINAPDINVHFRAHNFPERVKNDQQRTELIHDGCRRLLDWNEGVLVSLSVELELANLGYKASYRNETEGE